MQLYNRKKMFSGYRYDKANQELVKLWSNGKIELYISGKGKFEAITPEEYNAMKD